MQRFPISRSRRTDLLTRPPSGTSEPGRGWTALIVDPVEQIKELATLRARGLLSRDEFERQEAKLLAP
jgi:hypothetical protein